MLCVMQGGANHGLRAYGIGQVLKFAGLPAKGRSAAATLRRMWRPEDISKDAAYRASFSEVYASEEQQSVDLEAIVGKCRVMPAGTSLPGVIREHPESREEAHGEREISSARFLSSRGDDAFMCVCMGKVAEVDATTFDVSYV